MDRLTTAIHGAVLARLRAVAPVLVEGGNGDAVGVWVEALTFSRTVSKAFAVPNHTADHALAGTVMVAIPGGGGSPDLTAWERSLVHDRLRVMPPADAAEGAHHHGGVLTLKTRSDAFGATGTRTYRYGLRFVGGLYTRNPSGLVHLQALSEGTGRVRDMGERPYG